MPPITRRMARAQAAQAVQSQHTPEGPQGAMESFSQFARLPPELRQEIWSYCLPHCVVQIRQLGIKKYRPLIYWVCRESRSVASRHGRWQTMIKYSRPIWFDPTRDSINIDRYFPLIGWFIKPVLKAALHNPDIPLSLDLELIKLIHSSYIPYQIADWRNILRSRRVSRLSGLTIKFLGGRRACSVVLWHEHVHMSPQDACALGFFGLFGEQTPIHINVDDSQDLDTLSTIYRRWLGRETWTINEHSYLQSRRAVDRDICGFLKCVKTKWLKKHGALSRDFTPWELTPTVERRFEELLARLPQFNFVIAVHLVMQYM
ncbi:hypothetical protein F5Y05DRAFT_414668 [Hypoxylon sp. FL0543]|nr:hypothetical protein F5Y05DRAFT_414668 [Hypoxylon sp. FL0543]